MNNLCYNVGAKAPITSAIFGLFRLPGEAQMQIQFEGPAAPIAHPQPEAVQEIAHSRRGRRRGHDSHIPRQLGPHLHHTPVQRIEKHDTRPRHPSAMAITIGLRPRLFNGR